MTATQIIGLMVLGNWVSSAATAYLLLRRRRD